MALFDDNVLNRAAQRDSGAGGCGWPQVQIEDAQNDVAKQLDQINNFIASGDRCDHREPGRTPRPRKAMSDAAAAAGCRWVYVNRQPINVDSLPDNQAFVASNESESSRQGFIEQCNQWKAAGKDEVSVYVMQGELSNRPPCSAPRTTTT